MFDTARDEGEIKRRKEGFQEGKLIGEIKTYQNLLNNQDLPDDMIRHFEQKIIDLQNQLQGRESRLHLS